MTPPCQDRVHHVCVSVAIAHHPLPPRAADQPRPLPARSHQASGRAALRSVQTMLGWLLFLGLLTGCLGAMTGACNAIRGTGDHQAFAVVSWWSMAGVGSGSAVGLILGAVVESVGWLLDRLGVPAELPALDGEPHPRP